MAKKEVPAAVSEYFHQFGEKYAAAAGKIGGKRSLETMTAEERMAGAKNAAAASAAVRKKAAKKMGQAWTRKSERRGA